MASYTTSSTGATAATAAPLVRPSSATSSLATEYYGRPLHSASAGARTAEAAAAPAADRLYADHFRKQAILDEQRRIRDLELQLATQQIYCTPVSRALAAHRTVGGYSSYGERLYTEGRLEALKKEAGIAQIRAQEAEEELAGVTFHPQISRFAQNMKLSSAARGSSAGSNGSNSAAPWDRLHSQGSALKRERRAEAIRKEAEEEELKECSFKPRVDRNSARLVQERRGVAADSRLPLYQRLYNEGLFTKEKQQVNALMWLPDDATFKPKVNTSSVVMNDLLAVAEGDTSGTLARDVSERLLLRGKRCQEKLEAARQASIAPVDAEGRLLFKPKTLRAPKGIDRTGPIGEHLYTAALQSSAKAEAQAKAARKQASLQAASVHVNSVSIKLMEKLQRERLKAIYAYLARVGSSQMIPMEINLLEVLKDEDFMDTIDPEVRADVEHAGKLLRRTIKAQRHQQQNAAESDGTAVAFNEAEAEDIARADTSSTINENDDNAAWSLKVPSSSYARGSSVDGASVATTNTATVPHPEREALWAMSHNGEVTETGFVALMSEVLDLTRGIARQYLLPLPSARRKWEEPTFKPTIEPRSLALAARTRPEGLPAHEILYRTAQETAEKKEIARKEQEAAILKECSFQPTFVAAHPMVNQGRVLKMASQPPVIKRTLTKQEVEARREEEELCEIAEEAERRKHVHHVQQQKRGIAARGSSAADYTTTTERGGACDTVINDATAGIPSLLPSTSSADPIDTAHPTTTTTNTNIAGNSLEDGIDAIERQIQDAMARLNMTGASFVANLGAVPPQITTENASKIDDGTNSERVGDLAASCSAVTIGRYSSEEQPQEQEPTPVNNAVDVIARHRASLDYSALFDAESLAETPATSASAFSGTAGGTLKEEFSDFNPMKDGLTPANIEAIGCSESETAALPKAEQQEQQQQVESLLAQLAVEPLPADLVECTGSSC